MGNEPPKEPSPPVAAVTFWPRVQEHKVIQWGVGYLGVALALAHGAQLLGEALDWSEVFWRVVVIALVVGFPIALTIAWYQGHRGLKQISAGELAIVSVLVLIGALFFTYVLRPPSDAAPTVEPDAVNVPPRESLSPSADSESATTRKTIAVLPFVNMSSDPEQDALVEGLSIELIGSLRRIRDLTLTGVTSSLYFKGRTDEDSRTIGEKLGVANLLTGTMRKSGSRIRINPELIDARTGRQLWSFEYDRELADVFGIQDEIATAVAQALEITLGVGELGRRPGMTRNTDAYEQYVEGSALGAEFDPASIGAAIEHFERAVDIDRSFALAWAGLATALEVGASINPTAPVQESAERRKQADAHARELAADSPVIVARRADLATATGNWGEAHRALASLSDAGQNGVRDAGAALVRGRFLIYVGRPTEAVRELERLRAADPLDATIAWRLSEAYESAGNAAAAAVARSRGMAVRSGPQSSLRGAALLAAMGARDRAGVQASLASLNEVNEQPINVVIAARLDDPTAVLAELRRAMTPSAGEPEFTFYVIATWAAYYDDIPLAIDAARHLQNRRLLGELIWSPLMRDARKTPAFKALMDEVGLVAYFREFGWNAFCRPVGDRDFACE